MQVECLSELLAATAEVGPIDPQIVVHPDQRLELRQMGLTTAEAFLSLPGEIVSGHPDRHVMKVRLPDGRAAYLKREHRVRWKERFRNWLAGFGWTSKSVREGLTLRELEGRGFAVPGWIAFGEGLDGRGFLLVADTDGIDLRRAAREVARPAELGSQLGHLLATLHEQEIDHPDLFAKHVLLTERGIVLLDWQRTRLNRRVSWGRRIRGLAVLFASLPDCDREFEDSFFDAYLGRCEQPPPARFRNAVRSETGRLGQRGKFREQRQTPLPSGAQRLVWLDGEALCVAPEAAADLSGLRGEVYQLCRDGDTFVLSDDRVSQLSVGRQRAWASRAWSRFRGRAWRSSQLRRARLLFHLERHHVPAPRLIAYGQRASGLGMESFLLAEKLGGTSLPKSLSNADEDGRHLLLTRLAELLARVQEAGCTLQRIKAVRVRTDGGPTTLFVDPDCLRYHRRLSAKQKRTDWRRVAESMKDCCGPGEVRRFLDLFAEGNR